MKKLIKLLIIAYALLIVTACNDDTSKDMGQLKFINATGDTYKVEISGYQYSHELNIGGSEITTLTIPCNMYNIDVLQLDGYFLFPTKEHFTVTITHNTPVTIELPNTVY
ncbi:MAG: hypothetical protein IJM74_00020 [Bacteroidales bacterium]|nr:hypothetical protein [Bacteroidales bacterium]